MKSKIELLTIIFIMKMAGNSIICDRIKVSVYYESLCPYSINFIKSKLYPNYQQLRDYIQIEWVPFGKTNYTRVQGKWSFRCQHGKDECKSNKYQACALDQGRSQDRTVEFIKCVMSLSYPGYTRGIEYCAKASTFNWDPIDTCMTSGRGDDLLAKMGRKTDSLRPKLKQVPTIVFNDEFDPLLCDYALENFVKATCSLIIGKKPDVCRKTS